MTAVTLFLCGDVMTGRSVDQILRHPSSPELHESWIRDARDYVALAEEANGPIPRHVDPDYIWGDALMTLSRLRPAARIINLETSITTSDAYLPDKPIHYRMHPANADYLSAAQIDVCALANNHVLDFGVPGLMETLDTLHEAHIRTAGAGRNIREAELPAVVEVSDAHRVVVFSLGAENGGVPEDWSATENGPGVDYLPDLSTATANRVLERVARVTQPGDVVVASIHWGSNWGYDVPDEFVRFAHRLVDGGVAVVHGHSSHHPRPIELYGGRLILYGCGDFLTDYEGISGHERFRGDLALMYFPTIDADTGELVDLHMLPIRVRRFRATVASDADAEWLRDTLVRESARFGTHVDLVPDPADDTLALVVRAAVGLGAH